MNNISNLKEKVLIVIPIINNYKIFKDSFYNKNNLENRFPDMLTRIGEFRLGNKTIWVVFDIESESEVQKFQFLHPNSKFQENDL